jgi:hypothetical protein
MINKESGRKGGVWGRKGRSYGGRGDKGTEVRVPKGQRKRREEDDEEVGEEKYGEKEEQGKVH